MKSLEDNEQKLKAIDKLRKKKLEEKTLSAKKHCSNIDNIKMNAERKIQ
jgi:hypothetical protein